MARTEALTQLEEYRLFGEAVQLPLLANMTEFGVTPLFTTQQLAGVGVSMVLYPLSAFRAMSAAALHVYTTIRQQGTQQQALPLIQTRQELYAVLHYETYQQKIDQLFGQQKGEAMSSKTSGGLAGIVVGETAISAVEKQAWA
jgi:methylisocitrate lyase